MEGVPRGRRAGSERFGEQELGGLAAHSPGAPHTAPTRPTPQTKTAALERPFRFWLPGLDGLQETLSVSGPLPDEADLSGHIASTPSGSPTAQITPRRPGRHLTIVSRSVACACPTFTLTQ